MSGSPLSTITEDDIVEFLVSTPDFFARHSEVLASVRLTSPHGNRAVSLSERQTEMLREKIRVLELRLMELIRHGSENDVLHQRLLAWAEGLMRAGSAASLPERVTDSLAHRFMVPQVSLRLWGLSKVYEAEPFVQGVSPETSAWAQALDKPLCGPVPHKDLLAWLAHPLEVQSMAVIPLRADSTEEGASSAFGLLVLASPDPQRFHANMGTELLQQLGRLAGACLARLRLG